MKGNKLIPVVPISPKANTLDSRCLLSMLNGKRYTHPEFEAETKSWRLAAVVHRLKDLGWPVKSYEIYSPTPSARGRYIKCYFISLEDVKKLQGAKRHE